MISSVAATPAGVIMMLAMAFLAPLATSLAQMVISRTRESAPDSVGVEMCGEPMGLAPPLSKLVLTSERVPMDAPPQTAHFFIVKLLSSRSPARFFSTHPLLEERISRLRPMAS